MMETAVETLTWIFLLTGCAFAVIGGIGLLRLPDLFSRMHGAGLTDTLGAGLLLTGLMIQSGFSLVTVKLLTILLLLLVTSPTSTHALAQSALSHGLRPRVAEKEDGP